MLDIGMLDICELNLAQADGGPPTTLAAGSAPGESGVAVLGMRFRGSAHFSATPRQHLVCFQMSPRARLDCRTADRTLRHVAPAGSLAIYPAGVDCAADVAGSVEALLVAVQPGRFALAAAEESAAGARLLVRMSGEDRALFDSARLLARESADHYPNGPLFWHELAAGFIDRLVAGHASAFAGRARGKVGNDVLARVTDYVVAHLHEPIKVATLAQIAGQSEFHFARMFARTVGMTPHRYIVRLRLRRAIELVREGQSGPGEIAVRTGFADQSHLSRWVRRVHGVTLTQFLA
jgi:AraC family transcriptional regulator